jgi:hypothetical protein
MSRAEPPEDGFEVLAPPAAHRGAEPAERRGARAADPTVVPRHDGEAPRREEGREPGIETAADPRSGVDEDESFLLSPFRVMEGRRERKTVTGADLDVVRAHIQIGPRECLEPRIWFPYLVLASLSQLPVRALTAR